MADMIARGMADEAAKKVQENTAQLAETALDIGEVTELGYIPQNITKSILGRGFNVKDFGVKGDGVTDDSDGIKKAIEYIMLTNPTSLDLKPSLYFPPGTYMVHSDKIFSSLSFTSLGLTPSVRNGITFRGENKRASILKLITGGVDKWFYDNESINSQKFGRLNFEHLTFTTDDKTKGHGFKQWSQGGEKQFKFFACELDLAKIMQFEGTGNADLNRFLMCSIVANDTAFTYNNNQAVSTELVTTDLFLGKGLLYIKNGGGGSFKIHAGNLEMHPHATDTTDHYLFDMDTDPNLGQGNCDFNFNDIRFEIHGINKKLVRTTANNKPLDINFTRCQFGTVPDGSREVVYVTPTKRVVFDNCILNDNFTYKVEGTFSTSSGSPSGAQLMFYNCDVGRNINLHERIVKVGDVYRVIAENCFRQSSSVGSSITVQDFDFGWDNIAPAGISAKLKIVPIKQSWNTFPTAVGGEKTLLLPSGCFIKRIYIKKPAIVSTSDNFNLKIGNDAKSIVLGESGLKAHNTEHLIDIKDIGVLSYNKLRIWGEGIATTAQSGGVAYVEYI
ncbi:glycosyl hydrolase family 28-related protein [Peribacillus frigoritolerans]|uniref:glycosyl hydrolase family 28-related protein n=1 Tax=Peribacillus frigoritolerans TaxID=450367 RepID=UPI003D06D9A8